MTRLETCNTFVFHSIISIYGGILTPLHYGFKKFAVRFLNTPELRIYHLGHETAVT